jgi:hypothetical protein
MSTNSRGTAGCCWYNHHLMGHPSASIEQELRNQTRLGRRLLATGVVLVLVGSYFFIQTRGYVSSATRATGKVTEIEKEQRQKKTVVYPVFCFADSDGTMHTIHTRQTRVWSGGYGKYRVGDSVEVLYPAGRPEDARLNSLFQVWGWTIAFAGTGIFLVIVGVVLWYGAWAFRHQRP